LTAGGKDIHFPCQTTPASVVTLDSDTGEFPQCFRGNHGKQPSLTTESHLARECKAELFARNGFMIVTSLGWFQPLASPPTHSMEEAMITGAHSIIYSTNAEADRAFLRDLLKLTHVDVGHGWLIFGLPPAEVAVHPSDKNDVNEFYLMTDDIRGLLADMALRDIACGSIQDEGWGLLSHLMLPSGGKLRVYEPRHARPEPMPGKP